MGVRLAAWVLSRAGRVRSAREALVLSVLALHADDAGETIMTWSELCERTNVARSSLARDLVSLEEQGLLSRSGWKWGQVNGATRYVLRLPDGVDVGREVIPTGRVPQRDSVVAGGLVQMSDRLPAQVWVQDPLSGEGLRSMLIAGRDRGWDVVGGVLARAFEVTVDTRLGWLVARRGGMSREQARLDVVSRMWEAVRVHTDVIVGAKTSPWGVLVRIVARDVARADREHVPEVLTGEVVEGEHLDYERGVGRVLLADLFDSWEGAHQKFLHVLVTAGIGQGLVFNATRRMLEIAAGVSAALRITRARADLELLALGLSEDAIGAWMGLLVGTRRGGDSSSLLLHFASGGELTDGFRVRVERLAGLV